jgi:putative ABC transport system permease protein
MVTPEFFDLANARAVTGRLFTWQDDERAPLVTVVNQSFARRFLAGVAPLGRRVRLGTRELTIVGVVRDLLIQDVEDSDGSGFYLPLLQARPYTVRVMSRTVGAPMDTVDALHRTVADADPDLPLLEIATLYDAIYTDKSVLDALAILFMCFGLGAVFLALIGLYAVLSFVVTQQTREFGVRMALGASAGDIVRLVLKRGGMELAWGLSLGLVLAFVLSRVLAAAIERIPPAGPMVFAAIGTVVTGGLLALWRPLRQAVRLEPAQALRAE